jgi:hypothetical protein
LTWHALWFSASLGLIVVLSGCAGFTTDVSLVRDHRVHIESPRRQARVGLPVTLRWSARDVDADETFGLFFDTPPIKPGASMRSLPEKVHDDACLIRPTCPEADWLSGRGIYLTKDRSFVLRALPDLREQRRGARDSHQVTIILLRHNRRVGEAGWTRQFYVERGAR